MATIELQEQNLAVFKDAIKVMSDFKSAFGHGLSIRLAAALYAAEALGLKTVDLSELSYDALGPHHERYQINCPAAQSPHVYIDSLEFDYLVLVNLDKDFRLTGMWRISREQAATVFTEREDFSQYWATQNAVKNIGEAVISPSPRTESARTLSAGPRQNRTWREIRGAAPFPLVGEDAQQWVSRSRKKDDENQ